MTVHSRSPAPGEPADVEDPAELRLADRCAVPASPWRTSRLHGGGFVDRLAVQIEAGVRVDGVRPGNDHDHVLLVARTRVQRVGSVAGVGDADPRISPWPRTGHSWSLEHGHHERRPASPSARLARVRTPNRLMSKPQPANGGGEMSTCTPEGSTTRSRANIGRRVQRSEPDTFTEITCPGAAAATGPGVPKKLPRWAGTARTVPSRFTASNVGYPRTSHALVETLRKETRSVPFPAAAPPRTPASSSADGPHLGPLGYTGLGAGGGWYAGAGRYSHPGNSTFCRTAVLPGPSSGGVEQRRRSRLPRPPRRAPAPPP